MQAREDYTFTKESANFRLVPQSCGNCNWYQAQPFGPSICREIKGLTFNGPADRMAVCDRWVRE